jgi:hypothetical protein
MKHNRPLNFNIFFGDHPLNVELQVKSENVYVGRHKTSSPYEYADNIQLLI